ncbi:MAG: sugar ABC transporter ATP-binding protein [Lachnospiraceae bacterium]|nr:sugar ABC transporter ATP-binding protein [Lachnospiraceae bacterium]MDN4743563.1 sugar ABC transporter ATP-binding protein [Lachnospiraceae bacterium C1.1]
MKNITKTFPGVKALDNVSLELEEGEVHALLGENGAGKSTLIKVLGGIYHADSGEIEINGNNVKIDSVQAAEKNGVAIIHQELVLVPYMTVAENIFLGRELGKGIAVDLKAQEREAQKVLDELGMNIHAGSLVKDLSIAQQQMVEITKAVSAHSKILVMDEPTSSIAEKEVDNLFKIMRDLTSHGVGIIYISHKMSELQDICDRVTIMRDGQSVDTKVVKETSRDELIALMVGRQLTQYYERDFQKQGEELLRVEALSDGDRVKNVSFTLHKGEIIGFSGLVGAGRSETMAALFGLTKLEKGEVYINGKKTEIKNPKDAMAKGIAFVPENRKEEGLYLIQDVRYNSTIEVLEQFISHLNVDSKKEGAITQKFIDMMRTKTPSQAQIIGNLSGGNQQKVMIGRWLATDPKILILDEPTRGIDVGAKSEIYAIMNELVKNGVSIIMISSELPEIINMSDRIYVMADGEVKGCLDHTEVSQESIMNLAAI